METSGMEGSQKRSPLDMIMNQLRRKRSITERKKPSVGRLFWSSENSVKRTGGISDIKESEGPEGNENGGSRTEGDQADADICSDVGFGRVRQFVEKLGKKPDTHSLSLSNCDLTATDVVELATLLPFLNQLEMLDFSWNDLVGGSLKALVCHLQHVGRLQVLKLSSCRLTALDLNALGEALDCVPLLEVLDLSWNAGVGGGNLRFLTDHLPPGSALRELHLVDCQLSEADTIALGEALKALSYLEVLDLSTNRGLARGMGHLIPFLSATPNLSTLRLSMCGLHKASFTILNEALNFLPNLQNLDLSCNKEASGGVAIMASNLTLLTHLQTLDLHSCGLTEDDILALVQAVPSLPELTELDVSSNSNIGNVVNSLLSVLPLARIRKLPLNNCNMSSESYQTLAKQSLPVLENLNLSWNKRCGGNLKLLLEPLQTNCKLQDLRLSSCDLTTEDILYLASAVKRGALSQLSLLDLSYNSDVGDSGWGCLFEQSRNLKALEEMDISLRPSSSSPASSWLPALLDSLPHLPSLRRLSILRWALSPGDREKLNKSPQRGSVSLEYDQQDPKVSSAWGPR